jgi:hypothetical protein
MTGTKPNVYKPEPTAFRVYDELYRLYLLLHDAFGVNGTRADLSRLMKDLVRIRMEATK